MDRDRLLDELYENLDITQETIHCLKDDINKDLPIDSWEYIDMHLLNAITSLDTVQKLYEKEIERLGGNM